MYTFPKLIKEIRDKTGLTQSQFADVLGVSAVLIAMVETGQKEVSKKFIVKLAEKMHVHPTSITPFIFIEDERKKPSSEVERLFVTWGEKMQSLLIEKGARRLKQYAK